MDLLSSSRGESGDRINGFSQRIHSWYYSTVESYRELTVVDPASL